MSLVDQLLTLRSAAHSLAKTADSGACLTLVRQGSPYDQLFFSEISDPQWLPTLITEGFFRHLPRKESRDGAIIYPSHLPLIALSRLAGRAPADVVAVLEKISIPDNPQVADQLMRVIAAIEDTTFANRLVPVPETLFGIRSSSDWIWLDDILAKWLEGQELEACLQVLRAYLETTVGTSDSRSRREDWQTNKIDREVIAPLARKLPLDVGKLIFDSLRAWADLERAEHKSENSRVNRRKDPDNDDPPTYWLEEFGSPSIGSHDLESTLAHRIYSIGQALFESGDEGRIESFDKMLREDRWFLFGRLRWQLYAEFPSRTLAYARRDTLERIPNLDRMVVRHSYEFAQMLEAHSKQYGGDFLTPDEVAAFVEAVLRGPIMPDETIDESFRARFQHIQLSPIRALLTGDVLAQFHRFSEGSPELELSTYKPFSSGGGARTIEHVPPTAARDMSGMTDSQLWNFLNTWLPERGHARSGEWWIEEDVGALGEKFAEYFEMTPSRFSPESKWWRNLRRPTILQKPLARAASRLEKKSESQRTEATEPTKAEWQNWFGVAAWIVEQHPQQESAKDADRSALEDTDWNWSRVVVINFLKAALRSAFSPPEDLLPEIGRMLRKLVEDRDPRLDDKEKAWSDWLTSAINSVRGTAIEGLLELGLFQKKRTQQPEGEIFDMIADRLRNPNESPAIFAILGAHLRLLIHLFPEAVKAEPDLFLPGDRPEQRTSFLTSHFRYDNPMSGVIETLPSLPDAALQSLREPIGDSEDERGGRGEFASRLGSHLSFYYWNAAFRDQATADRTLDAFFEIAKPEVRAMTIGQIGRIFENSSRADSTSDIYERVLQLWDRRFLHIEEAIDARKDPHGDFDEELSRFIDWLSCECFPLEWRFDRVVRAIRRLEKGPSAYNLVETLDKLTSAGEHIDESILILREVLRKTSDELRWSYRDEHLKPLLTRGLNARKQETRELAEQSQEMLLREGFFEYLDLNVERPSEG